MLKIDDNWAVHGFEPAIRGMRNPMNSWSKSDSCFLEMNGDGYNINGDIFPWPDETYADTYVGPNDHDLMMRLAAGGPVHAKYRRMIIVYADITAPLYWWKEFDTYKVGTVANSCSTMHKIHSKEFTLDDFSCEHLLSEDDEGAPSIFIDDIFKIDDDIMDELLSYPSKRVKTTCTPIEYMNGLIHMLNDAREQFLETKDKRYWWQMIQLLPTSYNQKRTVMLNYEVLHNIYIWRKDHKLDEWHTFCDWIKTLPYSELITMEEKKDE